MRFALTALLLSMLTSWPVRAASDVVLADFEGDNYGPWTVEGTAFGTRPARGTLPGQQEVYGFRGRGLANTFLNRDVSRGTLTSPEFTITHKHIAFLIGGGHHPGEVGVDLLLDGKAVRSAGGANREMLSWHTWDVSDLAGKNVRIQIFDNSAEEFGHINADHFIATDTRRVGTGAVRLSEYRKAPEYYNERYRPQFHFTPEINWTNDPNGLVYHDGEYHLFYQHNPHGRTWGHMSWGHAVSTDLVRWKHLPIALHEEYGVMIFSGSAVVDTNNTSGFGKDGEPPLVAIYTGHGLGKQTQDIAYSNDRGRTWLKYVGNPVIDLSESDFRDPKVFWHEPTERWIMIVSLAAQKRLQFYASPNLKTWTHLSDFGPAGVKDKPNWECPDIFELPIEGEPGSTRWVLEVDMGNNSIAGGSGGEYFVGTFDGHAFHCDHDLSQSQWVDYGRDFYAPVSWSNVPPGDGRRLWIGWMNNWETNLLPTHPWRGGMSLPRSLSLRRGDGGLRLIQTPVKELESLRTKPVAIEDLRVRAGELNLGDQGVHGDCLEVLAEFEIGDAAEFGLRLRQGHREQTVVGYLVSDQQVFVDRTQSGESDFHDKFSGRHTGPLQPRENRILLHLFVDTSSIEVFGNRGETVITDRVFPDPSSQGVTVYSRGGDTRVKSLRAWRLASAWR